MARLLTLIVCVIASLIYAISLFEQLSNLTGLGGNTFWFLVGALIQGIIYLWARPSFILLVLFHELNHAIVGWLMGAQIRSVEASANTGGAVQYDYKYSWGQEMISLAPYFFQPIPLVLAGVKAMVRTTFDPLICVLMGATWLWFYFDLATTLQVSQTDITKTGTGLSLMLIVTMNLILTGIVLCSIAPETSVAGFLWDGPVGLYRLVVGLWN